MSPFEEKMFNLIFGSVPVDYTEESEANLMKRGPRTGEYYGKTKEGGRAFGRRDERKQGGACTGTGDDSV